MDDKKWIRILFYAVTGVLVVVVGVKHLLPIALPFLLGALIAKLTDPAVRFLRKKSGMPRWLCTGVAVGVFYLLLGTGIWLLCKRVCVELTALFDQLPGMLSTLAEPMARLHTWLTDVAKRAPDGLGTALENWVQRLFSGSSGWMNTLNQKVFSYATTFLGALPNAVLFLVMTVLSSFFLSSRLPEVSRWLHLRLPAKYRDRLLPVLTRLKQALTGWCIAQLKLMGITFCIVTAGLFFLGVDYALLFGLIIALIDALPVFGSGIILIPWGLMMFLRGQIRCGIGFLILYGVTALTRTSLEPKIVGQQIGLHPLLTLPSIYAGYRLMGIVGMILFPIGTLLVRQVLESYRRSEPT